MTNEITPFLVRPSSLSEAMELSKMICASSFCPASMKGKSGDVLLALQMGSEIGLSMIQSIQNIAVINGKPCLYGDAALAVAMSCKFYEYHKEWLDGSITDGTRKAHCLVKRQGSDEYIKTFSIEDAKKANLWGKAGPWAQYPDRMLQMRARSFAIRDQFADALKGINIREEVEDFQPLHKSQKQTNFRTTEIKTEDIIDGEIISNETHLLEQFNIFMDELDSSTTIEQLQKVFKDIKAFNFNGNKEMLDKLIKKKDEVKMNIIQEEAMKKLDSVDVETSRIKS